MIKINWKSWRKLSDASIRKARDDKLHPTASSVVNISKKKTTSLLRVAFQDASWNQMLHQQFLKISQHTYNQKIFIQSPWSGPRKLPSPSPFASKILRIHSYAKPPCVGNGHKGHNEGMVGDEEQRVHTEKLALKNAMFKRRVKTLQQKVRRRKMKIKNMIQLIAQLKDKLLIKTGEASLLHNDFDGNYHTT